MNANFRQSTMIACLFTWIGFVCAISFLEAWLKFQAPGVTLPIGLGIGKLVFGALNKVEWAFALVTFFCITPLRKASFSPPSIPLALAISILVLQTAWLLPGLDASADRFIRHQPVTPSPLHIWFVCAEVIKVGSLLIAAISLLKKPVNTAPANALSLRSSL